MAKILVVDDTRNIRKMVSLTLEKAGHDVTGAEDGQRGLAIFGDGSQWDLVLLDERMPLVMGHEMAREVRERDAGARLIMMTAFATAELATEMIEGGALDFLRKPFSTDTLRYAVEKALARPQSAPWESEANPEAGASKPQITLYAKGFDFWPILLDESGTPPGVDVGRPFWVQGNGEKRRTLVGVTPHVRQQIQVEMGRVFDNNSHLWDAICEMALSQFLFENGTMPPKILPLFEMTDSQLITLQNLGRNTRFNGF